MSFNFVLCLGFLFLSPFLINVDASKGRFRRSLMDMRSMVNTVVKGRKSLDFVGYGNWCGLGGSGKVLDPIDQCCQTHDMCYDLALKCSCKEQAGSIYRLPYSWKVAEDGTATCDDTCEGCEGALCMCDALLTNCLRAHNGVYQSDLRHSMSIEDLMQQARQI